MELSPALRRECQLIARRYPRAIGALVPVLLRLQRQEGFVSLPAMEEVAELLQVPPSEVRAAVEFYPALRARPLGRHCLEVCSALPCRLAGAPEVLDCLRQHLGIAPGQVQADGRCGLAETGCVGACSTAPAMLVDGRLHQSLTREGIAQLLEALD